MDNLTIYNNVRAVPKEALKEIQAGRLKGKSDINPMWRIKTLTEQFGVCGIGWKYIIKEKQLETGPDGEMSAFVDIDLFIKVDGEWSAAIPGTGGSSFVANETKGLYQSDECFKMALTDALSVACKALGIGADVYWDKDSTKYSKPDQEQLNESKPIQDQKKQDVIQDPDIEKRAKAIYWQMTGNKDGQHSWPLDEFKSWLRDLKEQGIISTDYSKKWTLEDVEEVERQIVDIPF